MAGGVKGVERGGYRVGTLCWRCGNAINGCSWSREFKPVDGWNAEKTKLKVGKNFGGKSKSKMGKIPYKYWIDEDGFIWTDSYKVIECPEFIKG